MKGRCMNLHLPFFNFILNVMKNYAIVGTWRAMSESSIRIQLGYPLQPGHDTPCPYNKKPYTLSMKGDFYGNTNTSTRRRNHTTTTVPI